MIEDDDDDKEIIVQVLNDLKVPNLVHWFISSSEAFKYLKETPEKPFLILCDVNLPGLSGIEFKKEIDSDPQLRKKSIPFVFYSTSIAQSAVDEAYIQMTVQGFFQKGDHYEEIKKTIDLIVSYWKVCRHPNSEQ
jgi:CheY-like chemotaxis protein